MKYGEKEIANFDPKKDLELWENTAKNDYTIKITLPEFCCLCPRSGYPDFATLSLEYIPNDFVIELKALKLYINSFLYKHISHEASINEIYNTLKTKLKPKWIKLTADFNPRGNVYTTIECRSDLIIPESQH
ncbi:preQ(1) synthase [Campylobacter sp. MIT 21-1685]|uniref:preQ(1) synthase n=1 Tax=unclassified Campylobacter TaxID=2593542 RepID=UPI00224B3F9D|nr:MULTISPECIES: preQ(1) synthase [unclassified Campylobacter]MCX2683609.1 preQ(1) synthase [Campylobacter sp. MIT 21-1684]MCX2751892.1 preQ(1) synthase [Campylobacter sp. MIT 21-1682]MCX2808093.1 preQ(1) synthase [Campylobacter sp. MIT 21-1685]